jgi:hypothetical protein
MTDLTIFRGDTKSYDLTFTSGGSALNITGYTIFFTVKPKANWDDTLDTSALIQKNVTSHTNAAGGLSEVLLSATDTNIEPGVYMYDMQLKDGSGNILTFINGNFTVTADVTRRTT